MTFNQSSIWVQIHDIPLGCMMRSVGSKIGNSMGKLKFVDIAEGGIGYGRYLRIIVKIDLLKPLEDGRSLHLGDQVTWVRFKYEKPYLFCFDCGCILHGARGCLAKRGLRFRHLVGEKP